eukprot:CAMPEP_0182920812 /NCGR_PEP_ID=MMETSP0105_2-20130417/3730_1 /TAXON_ID=81532 ORGANISM="Acanthoeca-like sp., Strain 10tr" /NCGR_SAMPLE_ID=MMETSP0105_2 /ASSEMBLY_ACC=CAM_ASM_000205 /LENGTH=363 /DNA_ID=CAMNT_0025058265 /DNA_START=283 /DNA_END=1374 /DNA_ORIENTATION=+
MTSTATAPGQTPASPEFGEFVQPSSTISPSAGTADEVERPTSQLTIESLISESDDELIVPRRNDRDGSRTTSPRKKRTKGSLEQPLVSPHDGGADVDAPGEPAVGNRFLLYVAMVSFSLFAIAELAASILAKSESLFGDSMTMMIDGLTYAVNLWADKAKQGKPEAIRIKIDTIAPALSLAALVAVTIYITVDAARRLSDKSKEDSNDANAEVMWSFALVNLILDFGNIALFFVGKSDSGRYYLSCNACNHLDLNMMSAFVHVGADTMRSVAVLGAGIAADANAVSSDRADAIGAIVVSIAITLSCIPLISGLWVKRQLLKEVRLKDLSELMAVELVERTYADEASPTSTRGGNDSLLVAAAM